VEESHDSRAIRVQANLCAKKPSPGFGLLENLTVAKTPVDYQNPTSGYERNLDCPAPKKHLE
jgi:hypothetical protein